MTDLMEHFSSYTPDAGWTFYHGTPDVRTWQTGARYGIHVGTREAARQALEARIGKPHEGEWDGTREYGKTLLNRDYGSHVLDPETKTWTRHVEHHEPSYPTGEAGYSPDASGHSVKIPMDARPHIFPVRITGPMTNHPAIPHEDFKANGLMAGQLKRGRAKSGYFYRNVSEDEGSISAVVPSAAHLERLDVPKTAGLLAHFAAWHPGPHYHGTRAELEPGDLIEPNKYPPTMPDPDIRGEKADQPREHTYFSPRRQYVTEHYGPNVYEVEPTGDYRHDPEYGWTGGSRYMFRSKEPLRIKRKVSGEWGLPHEALLEHFGAAASWQTGHRPERGPGLHEMAGHPDIDLDYGSYYGPEREVRAKIERYRGKPDEPVTIYRAGGPPRHGDWVSLTPHFAQQHRPGEPVHEATVPARHVRHAYSDWLDEAGYFPGEEGKTAVAVNPPCHYCGDPLDEESIAGHNSAHEECEEMHSCPVHGDHDDPVLAEQHRDTYTDWSYHLPFAGGIHRGLVKQLPPDVHNAVHDRARPLAERASALRGYLHREGFHGGTQEKQPYGADHEGHLGVHWTPNEAAARHWGSDDTYEGPVGTGVKPSVTHVVLHAASPREEHIETDPDHLEARHMYGFEHDRSEHEVPLKYGAPVHLTGISWKRGDEGEWNRHDFARPSRHLAAAGEGFPNPYHGQMEGGRPEFSHTWFHGTKQSGPQLSEGRQPATRYSEHESWPQPNKMLGTHFSPLHSVAHGFAFPMHGSSWSSPPTPGEPSALVHAKLRFKDPAHFPTEDHLNLAIARWADRESPHWHDDRVNTFLAGSYQDQEGTHKDWHQQPRDLDHVHHLGNMAQHVMSWHPKLPEILHGFTEHLISQGHHGITYGNQVEGPYSHVSAIATRPSQIETTHVEHIAAPDRLPEPHEVGYARPGDVNHTPGEPEQYPGPHSSDLNESEGFHDAIEKLHTGQGKGDYHSYPRPVRLYPGYREHHEARFWPKSEFDEEPEEPDERESEDWSQGWPGFPHEKKRKRAREKTGSASVRYRIRLTVAKGYEVPDWHRPEHDTLESAQAEMTRLRQWDPDRTAIPDAEIREHKEAAKDLPYAGPYYHGTAHRFKAGDLIGPGGGKAHGVSSPEHVYLAASDWVARTFGGLAAVRNKAKTYSIYQVEPTGPTEPDPDGMGHRSRHPLRVVRLHERGASPDDPNPWWNQPGTGKGYPKQASAAPFLHGSVNRIEPGTLIHHRVPDEGHGRLQHNFFTESRAVAEDAADMRDGRGHGWIHTVEPTDSYERDPGEDRSWKSTAPLRVLSVEPGRLNGSTPHPPSSWARPVTASANGGDDFDESDGYVTCDQGHEHWGPHGAAFLLLRHTDPDDGQRRYLLQKRTSTGATDHPGTWALPGGALHAGEDSYAGARREGTEEMGSLPRTKLHHTVHDDHGGWFADTHVADVQHRFQPKVDARTGYEAEGHAWFTHDEVKDLNLHPGFRKTWDTVRRSRVDKEAVWDSSGSDKTGIYLRFGHWPENERSFSPAGGYHEDGVSAYDLNKHGNPDIDHGLDRGHVHDEDCEPDCDLQRWDVDNDPKEEMQGRIHRAERNRYYGDDKPSETAHLVRGKMAAIGYDGEPLLRDVHRVGDWIDHKHLFFPGEKPHRLARDEHDEGYKPPLKWRPKTAALDVTDHEGRTGDPSHITRSERGTIPTSAIAGMRGVRGEKPGEHRNRQGQQWEDFKADIGANGIRNPIFITKDYGEEPKISEGNHRRDAAVELGHAEVPVEIRYFGHAERQGLVHEAVITPGSLPPEQQSAFDVEDLREHRRQMLDVAKAPPPGTRVWRGERRPEGEDPETAASTGMHWSVNPDSIITNYAPEGHRHVVWQGIVEDHEKQAFPRSHPIWRGVHESYGHEAEVRFRPGAHVKLEGAYTADREDWNPGHPPGYTPGHLVPQIPERTNPGWKWHPLDRHIEIRHSGHGASDYSELGIPRESARRLPVTEIGPLYHGTTGERARRILEHGFEGDTVHLTPHADLAASYAGGRVARDGGGTPAVLKIDTVRGVSGHETGYMDPGMSRDSGADYQDRGPEVVVLNPAAIHGISRHAAAVPAMVP